MTAYGVFCAEAQNGPRPRGRFLRPLALGLTVAVICATATKARAADPRASRVTPAGVTRGTETEVRISGQRLADAQELLLYYPGVRVASLEAEKDNAVKAKLAVEPDCRLGMHALRVRTASGVSNLTTFYVGALPEVAEEEPNNEFETPQKIAADTTVTGVVENEDVDYFAVDAKKGERIAVEIEGLRLGDTFFDPYVAILDKDRFVLSGSDDTPLVWQDAVAAVVAPEDGQYVVQVRESAFGGSGACRYRLHVGHFPRPLAVYPAGGKPGQTLEVTYLGDPAGPRTEQVSLPGEPQPLFGLFDKDEHGIAPSCDEFRLVDLNNVLETEPNNAPAEATACEVPAALNGVIGEPGDVDYFKFAAKKGQQYHVRVYARGVRSPLDSVLAINRSGGAGVGSNDDNGGNPDSYVRLNVPEDDDYVVSIRDQLNAGGAEYVYRIEVTPVEPELTLGLPERNRYEDVTASVPQGNRTAVLVSASRQDFGGEVTVEAQGLPEGATVEAVPMPGNMTTTPMLLSAAEDAPLAGKLVDLVGKHVEGDRTVEGHLRQRTMLVRGQNNRDVWGHDAERMAVAVTQKVPYSIEVVQPKVPIVQNGSMQLKIVAKRDEGFDEPIRLSMLYNPPGVASRNVQIAKGQTEAEMALTANSNARVGNWKIAVLADATVGGGNVTVSSQLADLEVSEPFFKFSFPVVAVEQGQQTQLAVAVEKNKDFDGPAEVKLLGLPNEVTTEPREITKDSTEVVFPLATTEKSPPGHHKTLVCRAVVTANGEPIMHTLGGGQLRIQRPLPKQPEKKEEPKPEPKPEAKPEPPKEKPLSRLEQLRLQAQEAKEEGK